MTIKVGDKVPSATLMEMKDGKPKPVTTDELFAGKKVALFALPGAFTPTCSAKHVPGFVQNSDALKAKGVDAIACVSVNDAFVMGAWGKDQGAGDKVHMLADGNGDFTRAVGLEMDGTKFGMGKRSQRYSMIVDNGVVKALNVEAAGRLRSLQRRAHAEAALRRVFRPGSSCSRTRARRSASANLRLFAILGLPRASDRRAHSPHARNGRAPSAMRSGGAPFRRPAPATDLRSSPASCRRSSSHSSSSPPAICGAVHHIAGVCMDGDRARLLQRLQPLDHRHQLHAVVGGGVLAAGQFLFMPPLRRIAPQPPGPGLPEQAPSVKMSIDCRHKPIFPRHGLHLAGGSAASWNIRAGPWAAPARWDRDSASRKAASAGSAAPRRASSTGRAAISASLQRPRAAR